MPKSTKKKQTQKKMNNDSSIKNDVVFFIQLFFSLIVFFSIYGPQLMGPFGDVVQSFGRMLFSDSLPLFPWVLLGASVSLMVNRTQSLSIYFIRMTAFTILFLTMIDSFFTEKLLTTHGKISGSLTEFINHQGSKFFGHFGIRFMCFCGATLLLVLMFNIKLSMFQFKKNTIKRSNHWLKDLKYVLFYTKVRSIKSTIRRKKTLNTLKQINLDKDQPLPQDSAPLPPIKHAHSVPESEESEQMVIKKPMLNAETEDFTPVTHAIVEEYVLPPIDLLAKSKKSNAKDLEKDMREKSKALEIALSTFNVDAKVINITIGPSVSRFELRPGDGVKISKITNLTQDIALKLAVPAIRIEAPIPGKALVGIEIPNSNVSVLTLRSIINHSDFKTSSNLLDCVLGQTITGDSVTMALNKMPHILVAGSTGSGKSVCVNAIILSILLKARPDEVKFLMIDPKKVELSLYADIPHLLAPVVTNPNKAAATLKQWALVEMERRYEVFTQEGVKDLAGYNAHVLKSEDPEKQPMPHIVVIIDEFADLMMVASQEVENTICRLAQMARATGIHLVIATQRPSVNVVTGLIKANIPARLSFAVQSQIDSRTILDMAGAEKLLGKGDMLYLPSGASKPMRVQGVFVSEPEVNNIVGFIKKQALPEYVNDIINVEPLEAQSSQGAQDSDSKQDELYNQAKELIQSTQYASTSYLQRKLRIGYNRAARLMDELEEAGVVSNIEGDKKTRTVLPV